MTDFEMQYIKNYLGTIIPDEIKRRYFDFSSLRLQLGYNIITSFRTGGKTTNELLFCIKAFCDYNYTSAYIRTTRASVTEKAVSTMCTTINNTVLDDGRNYVQTISKDKYVYIKFHARTKTFRLLKHIDEDVKEADVFIYVFSIDDSLNLKSGFSDNKCDIIIYDEFVDIAYTSGTTILFLNLISTLFRLRYDSICFMNCNLSVGNPLLLRHFGIYEKILNQTTDFMQYKTPKGTKIFVTVLQPAEETIDTARLKMNERYFGFDIEGIDNITGMSICKELYRTLPDDAKIIPTNIYIHACGNYYRVFQTQIPEWQNMYYIKQTSEPVHKHGVITITDDKIKAFETPYTYYNMGGEFPQYVDLYHKYKRNDICYENYMTFVTIKSFYSYFNG